MYLYNDQCGKNFNGLIFMDVIKLIINSDKCKTFIKSDRC